MSKTSIHWRAFTHIFSLRFSNVWKMLHSSIFLKLIFCQKKFSSAVNFRKVKSIYKSKHKHEVMKTRRAWGVTGSQAAEFTAGAALAGECGGVSFPLPFSFSFSSFLSLCRVGDMPEGNRRRMCTSADRCWALGTVAERLGTAKGQILKSLRVGEIAG